MFDAFGDNLMNYFSDKNAKLNCNMHMCYFNDTCQNIKQSITKAYGTKIELKSSGYDTTFSLEIDQDMMLLPSPYGNKNSCQLPFFSIEQPHVRYGSLMLKKYNIFYDLDNSMMGIGLNNEDF